MLKRSETEVARDVFLARDLIELGARLPVLESEIELSRDRLIRLYREVKGKSPPRGMLPFSADWYMAGLGNVHSSLFINIYTFLQREATCSHLDALIKAYRLYLECCGEDYKPRLDMTRAWTLIRYIEAGIFHLESCRHCEGNFITYTRECTDAYFCNVCRSHSGSVKERRRAVSQ